MRTNQSEPSTPTPAQPTPTPNPTPTPSQPQGDPVQQPSNPSPGR